MPAIQDRLPRDSEEIPVTARENAVNALEKYLVVTGEVGELLMGRPFAGNRLRAERLSGNAT